MDPVTHVVVSRMAVALDRRAYSGAGAAVPIIGGLAPDIDAVFMPVGWDLYLRVHEAGTHSLLGGAAVALALAGLARWKTGRQFAPLLSASLISVLTHIALDAISGATIRLGWPFVLGRSGFGLVAMSDPWFVAPVAAALAITLLTRWRIPDIAPYAFAVLAVLMTGKYVSREAALRTVSPHLTDDAQERYVDPAWGSLTGWWLYQRQDDRMQMWRLEARGAQPRLILDVPRADSRPPIPGENRLVPVRNFLLAHDLPVRVTRPADDGLHVFWSDLRFCWRPAEGTGPAPGTNVRPAADAIACGVWFGGVIDGEGSVLRQFVTLGDYVQER